MCTEILWWSFNVKREWLFSRQSFVNVFLMGAAAHTPLFDSCTTPFLIAVSPPFDSRTPPPTSHTVLDPPGSEFVFYKVTRPKSCNKRTHFLAGRVKLMAARQRPTSNFGMRCKSPSFLISFEQSLNCVSSCSRWPGLRWSTKSKR